MTEHPYGRSGRARSQRDSSRSTTYPCRPGLLRMNRDFLAPWEPIRSDDYFTAAGQREIIRAALEQHARGAVLPQVILDEAGELVGCLTLTPSSEAACSRAAWVTG